MTEHKKQSFFGGAAVLAVGIALVKIIGAVFKIPLRNIIGKPGSADFTNAYNIYATFLTISTAGLPVALSKMVSEANALGRERQARKIFRVSFLMFLTLGVISFALMWWGDNWLAGLLNNPRAAYGIRALAPAVICVGCLSAFRGYAQGGFRMTPTAVSQIIEALCKLIVGLALATWLVRHAYPDYIAAAGAIMGVTCGTIVALVYMTANHLRTRAPAATDDVPEGAGTILRRLLVLAVPITLSASMSSLITLVDTSLVQGQLQRALHYTLDETRALYGTYGACMDLYNLPASLMVALTASVIPNLSAALTRRDRAQTRRVADSSLRVTALLAFPMGLGLWALAEPIMKLCYPNYDSVLGGRLLAVLGIASLFVCLMLVTNSILQAHGRVNLPIVTMLIGGVVKIALNYNLTAISSLNIHAAPIGTLVCFVIVAALNLALVYHTVEEKPNYFALFTKPLAASLLMAFFARGTYYFLRMRFAASGALTQLVTVGVTILLAIAVYFALVVALRIITADDLALLPKGKKLAKLLRIR